MDIPFDLLNQKFKSYISYYLVISGLGKQPIINLTEKIYASDWLYFNLSIPDSKKPEQFSWKVEYKNKPYPSFDAIFHNLPVMEGFRKLLWTLVENKPKIPSYWKKIEDFFSFYDKIGGIAVKLYNSEKPKELEKIEVQKEIPKEKKKPKEKGPKGRTNTVYLKMVDYDITNKEAKKRYLILLEFQTLINSDKQIFYCSDPVLMEFIKKIFISPPILMAAANDNSILEIRNEESSLSMLIHPNLPKMIHVGKGKIERDYPIIDKELLTMCYGIISSFNFLLGEDFYETKQSDGFIITRRDGLGLSQRDKIFLTMFAQSKNAEKTISDKFCIIKQDINPIEFEKYCQTTLFPEDMSQILMSFFENILENPVLNLNNMLISGIFNLPDAFVKGTCKIHYARFNPHFNMNLRTWFGEFELTIPYFHLRKFNETLMQYFETNLKSRAYKENDLMLYPIEKSITLGNQAMFNDAPHEKPVGHYRINYKMAINQTLLGNLFPNIKLKPGKIVLNNIYVQIAKPFKIALKVVFEDNTSQIYSLQIRDSLKFYDESGKIESGKLDFIQIENDARYIEIPEQVVNIPDINEEEVLWTENVEYILLLLKDLATNEESKLSLTINTKIDLYPYPVELEKMQISKIELDRARKNVRITYFNPEGRHIDKTIILSKGNRANIVLKDKKDKLEIIGFSSEIEGREGFIEREYSEISISEGE